MSLCYMWEVMTDRCHGACKPLSCTEMSGNSRGSNMLTWKKDAGASAPAMAASEAGPAAWGPVAALALFPAPFTEAFAPVLPPKLKPGAALPKAGLLTLLELAVKLLLLLFRLPLLPVKTLLLPVRSPLLPVRLPLLPGRLPLLPVR